MNQELSVLLSTSEFFRYPKCKYTVHEIHFLKARATESLFQEENFREQIWPILRSIETSSLASWFVKICFRLFKRSILVDLNPSNISNPSYLLRDSFGK